MLHSIYKLIFENLADHRRANSLAARLRIKRFEIFRSLIRSLPRPISILDVGGTEEYWANMEFSKEPEVRIVLLNIKKPEVRNQRFENKAGYGRNMQYFRDNEFDIVFSNSTIEHVGTWTDQQKFARETQRVGKIIYIQTPN